MVRSVFIDEAAALLGVSRRTVYYRIQGGRLKTVRTLGGTQRVLLDSIEEFLRAEHERRAQSPGEAFRSEAQALAFEIESLARDP